MELFWEKGYEATTTQDLCERTGLGRGSLYNAFGSKHALYEEAIKRYAETRAALQLQELAPTGGSVRDRLRELMVAMIDARSEGSWPAWVSRAERGRRDGRPER